MDPLVKSYPWNSAYAFAENDPVNFIDLEGLEQPIDQATKTTTKLAPEIGKTGSKEISKRLVVNGAGQLAKAPLLARLARFGALAGGVTGTIVLVFTPVQVGKGDVRTKEELGRQAEIKLEEREKMRPEPLPLPTNAPPEEDDEYITLYRGVHAQHPDLPNAKKGMAVPRGGHNDPKRHNEGDNESVFTSWTVWEGVAKHFAGRKGQGGVILEKSFKKSQLVPSPDKFWQGEVLVPGVVTGAQVQSAPSTRKEDNR